MNEYANKPEDYYLSRPEMLKYIPVSAKTILDIGCGTGLFLASIKKRQEAELWGVEINDLAAKQAETVLDKVLTGDISTALEIVPDHYFDVIVMNDVLEHLFDPNAVLRKIKPKLSKNGLVVSSIPNVRYYKVLFNLIFRKQWHYEDCGVMDWTHVRFFTKRSMIELFHATGYRIEKVEGINRTRHPLVKLMNILTFGWFSDALNLQYSVTARPI